MRYQSLALIAATVASVSAAPTQAVKRDWVANNKGNVKIFCKLEPSFFPSTETS